MPAAPDPPSRRRALVTGAALVGGALLALLDWLTRREGLWILLDFSRPAAVAALVLAAGAGWGAGALALLRWRIGGPLERLALGMPLGLGILSALLALAGVAGCFNRATVAIAAGLGLVLGLIFGVHMIHVFWARMAVHDRVWPPWLAAAAAPLLLCALGMAFLAALAPPVSYDVLEYHLAVPDQWIATGRAAILPHNFYSQLPFGVETLYGAAMALEKPLGVMEDLLPYTAVGRLPGYASPKLINFALLVLACLNVAVLVRRMGGSAGLAVLAAAHLALHGVFMRSSLDAFADVGAAAFAAAAALSACAWSGGERWKGALLTGLLAGFGLAAKTSTAGVFLAPALLFLILAHPSFGVRGRWLARAAAGALAFIAAAAAFSPWPIRAALFTGNPAAPFLNEWFGRDSWLLDTEQFWLSMHGWTPPFSLAYAATLAGRIPIVGWTWMLGALAAVFVGGTWPRRLGLTGLAGYGAYCLLTGAPDRFAAPVVALCVAASLGMAAQTLADRPALRRLTMAALLLLAGPGLWAAAENMAASQNIEYAGRALTRDAYWSHMLGEPTAELFASAGRIVPPDKLPREESERPRILLLYEARSHSIPWDCLANTVFDKSPLLELLRDRRPEETVAERLRRAGFTHLLVNEWELGRLIDSHATPATSISPFYRQVKAVENPAARYREFVRRLEWYAPYERMRATAMEMDEVRRLTDACAARAIYIRDLGGVRMFLAPIGE